MLTCVYQEGGITGIKFNCPQTCGLISGWAVGGLITGILQCF